MSTPSYQTPGIYIETMLVEPVRDMRTGVPLFVGLITDDDIEGRNARLPKSEWYYTLPPEGDETMLVVRKRGFERLPPRSYSAAQDRYSQDKSSPNQNLMLRAGEPMGANGGDVSRKPQRYTLWPQFREAYGDLARAGFLTYSVQGFFENEGDLCYVQIFRYTPPLTYAQLSSALETLKYEDEFDLVCVPDLAWVEMGRPAPASGKQNGDGTTDRTDFDMAALQMAVIDHCADASNRMAILDTPRPSAPAAGNGGGAAGVGAAMADALKHRSDVVGDNAALYFPWLRVKGGPPETGGCVPPCGHVAGIFNRTDARVGVHKAPANERIEGVMELEYVLDDASQGPLNLAGVNCLRVFGGRGVRVWGARTLSSRDVWLYINVRRVMLTTVRWIERAMGDVLFEPHTPKLWERVTRDITAYLSELARRGALQSGPDGAHFYVKCDAETNPPEGRDSGVIVTEIGMVGAPPTESIVIRLIHGPAGVRIEGPG